jgi:glyoxylase-like metal-dependent hydrolase (beta-lactamase superfamily II)
MTWAVGDIRVTPIVESEQAWPTILFLPALTGKVVDAIGWLRPHHVTPADDMLMRFQAFVVEADGARIVVDTCAGNDKHRSLPVFDHQSTAFLDDFRAAGFDPDSIDLVVCTHLHVDHVGWNTRLVDDRWVPTFPNARYLFGRTEYEHWSASDEVDQRRVLEDSVQPVLDAGLADLVDSTHALSASVRLDPTPGHTPGHHSVRLASGADRGVITGDVLHHASQVAVPALSTVADVDAEAARVTRHSFLSGCASDGSLMIGTHLPGTTAYRVEAAGDGFRLV